MRTRVGGEHHGGVDQGAHRGRHPLDVPAVGNDDEHAATRGDHAGAQRRQFVRPGRSGGCRPGRPHGLACRSCRPERLGGEPGCRYRPPRSRAFERLPATFGPRHPRRDREPHHIAHRPGVVTGHVFTQRQDRVGEHRHRRHERLDRHQGSAEVGSGTGHVPLGQLPGQPHAHPHTGDHRRRQPRRHGVGEGAGKVRHPGVDQDVHRLDRLPLREAARDPGTQTPPRPDQGQLVRQWVSP